MGRLILPQFVIAIGLVLTNSHLVRGTYDLELSLTAVDTSLSRITLRCRHQPTNNPVHGAEFVFESDSGPLVIGGDHGLVHSDPGEVEFTIGQDIEGLYYCRTGSLRSRGQNFTAYPKPVPDAKTHYTAVVGGNVTLPCGVGPGRLATRYRGYWIRVPSFIINTAEYIDPATFSLSLTNVQRTEDAGKYRCIVVVQSQQGQVIFHVPVQDITLDIYDLSGTDVYVLPGDTQPVDFVCSATIFPNTTMFKWKHNGRMISNSEKYTVAASLSAGSSTLSLHNIEEADTGSISCIVKTNEQEEVLDLEFSVLSDNFEVIFETNPQGITLYFTPEVTVPNGLQLWVLHTDTETLAQKNRTVPETTSSNTVIEHFVEVLYLDREFKLQAGLITNGVTGPLVPQYREAMTFLCNPDGGCSVVSNGSLGGVLGGIFGATALIGIVMAVIIVLVVVHNWRKNKSQNPTLEGGKGSSSTSMDATIDRMNNSNNGSCPSAEDNGSSAAARGRPVLQGNIRLKDVLCDVRVVASKWRELGTQLGVPRWRLDCIKPHNDTLCQQGLESVIDYWLRNNATDEEENRQILLDAVRSVNDICLADELSTEPLCLDYSTLICKLAQLASQWYVLGIQLSIPVGTLDTFHQVGEDPAADTKYLMDMLSQWKKGQYSHANHLIEALKSIGQCKLAETLQPKYEGVSSIVD